jgi:hypothetical protein
LYRLAKLTLLWRSQTKFAYTSFVESTQLSQRYKFSEFHTMLRVRTSTSQLFKTATQQITQTNVYSRTFHASVIRREEEEDEDTKAKRLQVEALLKPRVHPTVIPRRRRTIFMANI